jgi:peptide/nickel transport system substrate-binding protein
VRVRVVANPAAETEEVLDNRADVLDASDAVAPGLLGQVRTTARERFALTPEQETMYFFMDTRTRPFDSLRARQAVEYAVDRRALQHLASGFLAPSCYLLPAGLPGHPNAPCPYGSRPDLPRARRLLAASGMSGTRITVWGRATSPFAEFARYYASVLASIGLRPTLHLLNDSVYYPTVGSARTGARTGYGEWVQDYPQPSDFYLLLDARSIQPANNLNLSRVDDPAIQRALRVLDSRPRPDARAWAALERHTAARAYLDVIGQRTLPKFFSDRIDFGAAIISPVFLEDVSSWRLTAARGR